MSRPRAAPRRRGRRMPRLRRAVMLAVMPTTPPRPPLPMEAHMPATRLPPHPRPQGHSLRTPTRPTSNSPVPGIIPLTLATLLTLSRPPRIPMVVQRLLPLASTPPQVQQPRQATTLLRTVANTHCPSNRRRRLKIHNRELPGTQVAEGRWALLDTRPCLCSFLRRPFEPGVIDTLVPPPPVVGIYHGVWHILLI